MITPADILTSGGKHPGRSGFATLEHRENAETLCQRVNAMFRELGIDLSPQQINDGFRTQWVTYGAKNSWHKRGGAVDIADPGNLYAHRITRVLLLKYCLRREDTDFTSTWCHLDIGSPIGCVFKP